MVSNDSFIKVENKEQFIKVILNLIYEDIYNLIDLWRE